MSQVTLDQSTNNGASGNSIQVTNGAPQYTTVLPYVQLTSGVASHNSKVLGTTGAAGDYIKSLIVNVTSATDAGVFLQDGSAAGVMTGSASTAPSGTTTFAATASVAQTAAINAYANYILSITYIPTGGSAVTVKRRVISHAAFSATTAVSFVVELAIPAGASATSWTLEQPSAFQVVPFNQPVGTIQLALDAKSVNGGWKLSIGSTVSVVAVGRFS